MTNWQHSAEFLKSLPCEEGNECTADVIAPSTISVHRCALHQAAHDLETAVTLHQRRDKPDTRLESSLEYFRHNWRDWPGP